MTADIGSGTVSIMKINNRKPVTAQSYTEKTGVNQCVKTASNAMVNKFGMTVLFSCGKLIENFGTYEKNRVTIISNICASVKGWYIAE